MLSFSLEFSRKMEMEKGVQGLSFTFILVLEFYFNCVSFGRVFFSVRTQYIKD